jgi:hypothetical protein
VKYHGETPLNNQYILKKIEGQKGKTVPIVGSASGKGRVKGKGEGG